MSLKIHYLTALSLAVIFLSACKKDTLKKTSEIDTSKSSLVKISEAFAIGSATKVELWSDSEINTGYEKLYIALYDSITKKPITRSIVEIIPILSKKVNGTIESSSVPVENPQSFDAIETLFQCATVFTTPTLGDITQWKIKVLLKKPGQNEFNEALLSIYVKPTSLERVKIIEIENNTSLTVALISPLNPKIGINDFGIFITNTRDQKTYNFDNTHSIDIAVEMPLNKFSSTNNINPSYIKNGHYSGKVNLTKNGIWRITLNLIKNEKTVATFFDLSV